MKMSRLFWIFFCTTPLLFSRPIDVSQINQAIRETGAHWRASENELTALSASERASRLGLIMDKPQPFADVPQITLPPVESLPDSFDWRNHNGNWVTPVRDQGSCGSCWAFSALAQVESWWKIQHADPDTNLDLSEQFLLSCSDAGNCEQGGYIFKSLEFMTDNPLPLERYLPYKASSSTPCLPPDGEWLETAVTIPGWGYITYGEAQVENIKKALLYHPVSASYEVFSDFYAYNGGVYEHVFGGSEGWHAVLIVGWNDAEQSWIVKNSWGPSWGNEGYFRIKWGDSSFGMRNPFIWEKWSEAVLLPSTKTMASTLTYGDVDTAYFDITNTSSTAVQFYTMESWPEEGVSDWLTVNNSSGTLAAGQTTTVQLIYHTRELAPGRYKKSLSLSTNSKAQPDISISCSLTVNPPQQDARVTDIHLPAGGFPLLSWSSCSATIQNIGTQFMTDFDVVCQMFWDAEPIRTDTVHIGLLGGQQSRDIEFPAFKTRRTADVALQISIIHAKDDYNDFNNALCDSTQITHLVDSFEYPSDLWRVESGWGFSDVYNGHSGTTAAHVSGGTIPYDNQMNTRLTFNPGFELADIDTLFITYWTRYVTADSNDICFVDVSEDNLQWHTVDAFTGVHPAWQQRVINLTDYAQNGAAKAWIRFRFMSDEQGNSIGVLIDDIEAYMESVSNSGDLPHQTGITEQTEAPQEWRLSQNFPNPFNPATRISFSLPVPAYVKLAIFNMRGQQIAELANRQFAAGEHVLPWNAGSHASGLYFYTIEVLGENGESFMARKKMVLIQ